MRKQMKMLKRLRLLLRFFWHKWVKGEDIVGFYDGIPIIRSKELL